MQASPAVAALCRQMEGERLVAYRGRDGVWTNGVGHTRGVYPGQVITEVVRDRWLAEDIAVAAAGVNHILEAITAPWLGQTQFDAITDFVFNEGIGKFEASTMLRAIRTGDAWRAVGEFPRWVYCKGEVEPGLVKRRAIEQAWFREGLPQKLQASATTA